MKKTFQPTPAMIKAARDVFVAMAVVETIRPIVRDYQRLILAEGQWRERPMPPSSRRRSSDSTEPRVILDPEKAWLMSEADMAIYDGFCQKAQEMAGFYVEREGCCALLVAESELADAQNALVEVMEPVTNITVSRLLGGGMGKYKEYVDLTLKLLGSFVEGDHDPSRFVRCEESSLSVLRTLGVHFGAYDRERGGVLAILSSKAMEKVGQFPADYRLEPVRKAPGAEPQQAPVTDRPADGLEP